MNWLFYAKLSPGKSFFNHNFQASLLVSNRVTESFLDRLIHTLSDFYIASALTKKQMGQFGSFEAIGQMCRDNFNRLPDFSDPGINKRKYHFC